MYRYRVIKDSRLEKYLHEKGYIPILTTPIENRRDRWKYTYDNSVYLEIEIDNYYKQLKEDKRLWSF